MTDSSTRRFTLIRTFELDGEHVIKVFASDIFMEQWGEDYFAPAVTIRVEGLGEPFQWDSRNSDPIDTYLVALRILAIQLDGHKDRKRITWHGSHELGLPDLIEHNDKSIFTFTQDVSDPEGYIAHQYSLERRNL